MSFVDTVQIFRHWERFPPTRALVAAFMGFKPEEADVDTSHHLNRDEFARLLQATGGRL